MRGLQISAWSANESLRNGGSPTDRSKSEWEAKNKRLDEILEDFANHEEVDVTIEQLTEMIDYDYVFIELDGEYILKLSIKLI